MRREIVDKLTSVLKYILIIHTILLGTALAVFLLFSTYGTRMREGLEEKADAVFTEGWVMHQTLPRDLPLQQLILVNQAGEVELSVPYTITGSIQSFIDTYSQTDAPGYRAQLTSALGQWLEPLVDRYPYLGRSPTFLLKSYPQLDGSTVAVALWLPLGTRLIWTSYAALVYLFLTHWPVSVLWVQLDARQRTNNPRKWTMFTAFASIVGLIAYLTMSRWRQWE